MFAKSADKPWTKPAANGVDINNPYFPAEINPPH
jgi:hypothetical protein